MMDESERKGIMVKVLEGVERPWDRSKTKK
jgi:hypothetical protein